MELSDAFILGVSKDSDFGQATDSSKATSSTSTNESEVKKQLPGDMAKQVLGEVDLQQALAELIIEVGDAPVESKSSKSALHVETSTGRFSPLLRVGLVTMGIAAAAIAVAFMIAWIRVQV